MNVNRMKFWLWVFLGLLITNPILFVSLIVYLLPGGNDPELFWRCVGVGAICFLAEVGAVFWTIELAGKIYEAELQNKLTPAKQVAIAASDHDQSLKPSM